jgi:hypothetical protein
MANSTEDPIEAIQLRVLRVEAMVRCLAEATEPVSTFDRDLQGAFQGVADTLNGIYLQLDPKTFSNRVAAFRAAGSEVDNPDTAIN